MTHSLQYHSYLINNAYPMYNLIREILIFPNMDNLLIRFYEAADLKAMLFKHDILYHIKGLISVHLMSMLK